jgi:L-cysteine/cystine lyase
MDFAELRSTIPNATAMTYLNTGWAGPNPSRVLERMREAASRESDGGPAGPEGREFTHEVEAEAREGAARLLNVSPDDVVLTHGTTEGVNIVTHGMAWEPGDEMLITSLEHPALNSPSAVLEQRRGLTVKRAEISPGASADECITAIKEGITPHTKLVALSHIMFTCGLRMPAAGLVRVAHEAGVPVLLDGAQTGGQIAIDIGEIGADYYTVSGQKWLLGPTGSGALYISRKRQPDLTPLLTAPGLDSRSGLAMHTLASQGVVARAGFAEGLAINRELGQAAIEARVDQLASRLREGAAEIRGVSINGPTDPAMASGLTAVTVEGWEPEPLATALWERYRIVARFVGVPPGVRFCTAPFNDESDVDRTLEALRELAA